MEDPALCLKTKRESHHLEDRDEGGESSLVMDSPKKPRLQEDGPSGEETGGRLDRCDSDSSLGASVGMPSSSVVVIPDNAECDNVSQAPEHKGARDMPVCEGETPQSEGKSTDSDCPQEGTAEQGADGGVSRVAEGQTDADGMQRRSPVKRQALVGLKETDVGIIEYLSSHTGIKGILKQRYSDFMVHEISEDGTVVHLTDTSCPEKKSILPFDPSEVLSQADQEKLRSISRGADKKAECLIQVTEDKEQRTRVHQAIRHLFPKLDSSTVDVGAKKMVRVARGGGGKRGRSRWPKDTPNYCSFALYKENMDLNEALNIIAKYLHMGPHHFQYAGSKDKRGVTVQRVTAHRVDGERLAQLNKVLKYIRLGNFRYVDKPLNLGELSGNHFIIVLRMVEASKEQIDAAMTSLRDVGFINYFGMQRFGNSLIATYHVGRVLLLGQWQTAVDLILKPREGGDEDSRWREHWMRTRDAKTTLALLPGHKKTSVEQQLLRGLLKTNNDYLAAFSSIPRNTRLIYLHSYQSYVWNVVTTRRLQAEGMSPVIGDLVSRQDEGVDYVTADNLKDYTIYDVILPLPGHGVKFPSHQAGQWYTDILSQDGLTVEMLKNPKRDLSLTGAYRKCIVKPTDVDWAMQSYDDVKIPMVCTDREKLENVQVQPALRGGAHTAVKVEFSLPSSCYATMALREVMKTDTSAVHQSTLNQ